MTASALALDGPQGFLHAMDGEPRALADAVADLGQRWEILESGITVKLSPSCAGTHRHSTRFSTCVVAKVQADDVERIEIDVDSITPTILIYERPTSGLEGKFSMPFCVAAAVAFGRVDLETFDSATLTNALVTETHATRGHASRSVTRRRRRAAHASASERPAQGRPGLHAEGGRCARLSRATSDGHRTPGKVSGVRSPRCRRRRPRPRSSCYAASNGSQMCDC